MYFPPKLCPGDLVMLVAPSSPPAPKHVSETVEDHVRALEGFGFRVRVGESLNQATACGYAAASPELRVRDLHEAFSDPEVRAVWCARGGSTASSLLPLLDYELIARNPKPFIGLSDITALHLVFVQRCGFVTFHGPVSRYLAEGMDDDSLESLFGTLALDAPTDFRNPPDAPIRCLRPGKAEGTLLGGNLSLVSSLVGTPYGIDAKGKLLFLEDVGEAIYRLERMLLQLRYAGILDEAAGLVFGDFTRCRNAYNESYGPDELLRDFFADYPKPVVCGLRVGHCHPQGTLPFGCRCTLDAEAGRLTLLPENRKNF